MEESDGMKKILLVATGGTIASVEDGRGLAPALSGEELARYVPEIADVCDFDVVQPMNIDSTNMRPADWMRIRDEIVDAYDAYDGFVVLHGTDTMAYTAAALSYLVQGSPKPIVLTGSQQPMASPFTDAKLNLYQKPAVRGRRSLVRRVGGVRRRGDSRHAGAQAAHDELQRVHQRELPRDRARARRAHREGGSLRRARASGERRARTIASTSACSCSS